MAVLSVELSKGWEEILLPFSEFKASGSFLKIRQVQRIPIGVVAFGRDHEAEIDVREVNYGFIKIIPAMPLWAMQNSDKRLSEVANGDVSSQIGFQDCEGQLYSVMYRRKEYKLRIFGPHGYFSEKRRESDKDLISAWQNAAAILFT